jgi:hypothetical protein
MYIPSIKCMSRSIYDGKELIRTTAFLVSSFLKKKSIWKYNLKVLNLSVSISKYLFFLNLVLSSGK